MFSTMRMWEGIRSAHEFPQIQHPIVSGLLVDLTSDCTFAYALNHTKGISFSVALPDS